MSKEQDEFTGIGAQEDPDFLSEGGDFSATSVMGLEDDIASSQTRTCKQTNSLKP